MQTPAIILAFVLCLAPACAKDPPPEVKKPVDAVLAAAAFEAEGDTYAVGGGAAWKKTSAGWEFVKVLYDPDFFAKHYERRGETVFRRGDDGRMWEVGRTFRCDFEGVATLPELVGPTHRWTGLTLQSPRAKSIAEYVALRKKVLTAGAPFLDNRVEPSTARAHGGKTALRTHSVAATSDMVCAKASLDTEFLHFVQGDHVWISAWFLVEDRLPMTLVDLESSWIDQYPGIRLMFSGSGLGFELKWGTKPKWFPKERVEFPIGRWVHVVAHIQLDTRDGAVQLWQDGRRTVDGKGQTLPIAEAVLNNLEVGISATQVESTVWVDDLVVRDTDPRTK